MDVPPLDLTHTTAINSPHFWDTQPFSSTMKWIKTARRCIQGYDDTQVYLHVNLLELLEKIHPMWTWFFTLKINSYIFSIKQYKYSCQHISPVLVSHVVEQEFLWLIFNFFFSFLRFCCDVKQHPERGEGFRISGCFFFLFFSPLRCCGQHRRMM